MESENMYYVPEIPLHDTFDHCSIAATILRRFYSPHSSRISACVSAAHDLRDAVALTRSRNLRKMFDLPVSQPLTRTTTAPRPARVSRPDDDFHSLSMAVGLIMGRTP